MSNKPHKVEKLGVQIEFVLEYVQVYEAFPVFNTVWSYTRQNEKAC